MSVIGLMHFRVGETDGVSLEMDKWKRVLEKLGHDVFFISASHFADHEVIEGLDIRSDIHHQIVENAYHTLHWTEQHLEDVVEQEAQKIYQSLVDIFKRRAVDYLVVNNISSLGLSLPSAKAIHLVTQHQPVQLVYHHHDWYWEREKYSQPTTTYVKTLLETCFPPATGQHVVINRIAQHQLFVRKGQTSVVVPNVFDFDQPPWQVDSYNQSLRQRLDITDDSFVLLQATRIVYRKGIEIAVDIAKELMTRLTVPVVLVIAGMNEMEPERFALLQQHINDSGVDVKFINHLVGHERDYATQTYSLWDIYTMCDMVTYPSILEGWGNQLIEALFAEKMVFCYEYPVFKTDILRYKFKLISLGDAYSTRTNGLYTIPDATLHRAVDQCIMYLEEQELLARDVLHNAMIAKNELSMGKLQELLATRVFVIDNNL